MNLQALLAIGCVESAWAKDAEMALRVPDKAINAKKKKKSVNAGGPGSGRRPSGGQWNEPASSYGGPIIQRKEGSHSCPHCKADTDATGSTKLGHGVMKCNDCGGRFVESNWKQR